MIIVGIPFIVVAAMLYLIGATSYSREDGSRYLKMLLGGFLCNAVGVAVLSSLGAWYVCVVAGFVLMAFFACAIPIRQLTRRRSRAGYVLETWGMYATIVWVLLITVALIGVAIRVEMTERMQ